MPKSITNQTILELLAKNKAELEALNEETESFNKRSHELNKDCQQFVDLMNAEYGWGNWQNVNATDATFQTKEEFNRNFYVIPNPALKERVEAQDIELVESGAQEIGLEEFKKLYPDHSAFKEENHAQEGNFQENGIS